MRQAIRAIVVKDGQLLVMHRNKFGNEYYALVGGAIRMGENHQQTLTRELREESSVTVANPRLVIVEQAGPIFGVHFIYLCEYTGGEPQLSPDSEEAKITAMGKNIYTPMWLPISELPDKVFPPNELKQILINGLQNGFPAEPLQLTVQS